MRFRAGSWVEIKVLMPAFMVLGGVGGAAALNYI
ncbi:Metal-dependent hydrolase OS=Streptomyces cyaneofuscatus OX=66883 GN=G3I52_10165 PE=4 SV=1 [Streptomyces cyaneofuscatus]